MSRLRACLGRGVPCSGGEPAGGLSILGLMEDPHAPVPSRCWQLAFCIPAPALADEPDQSLPPVLWSPRRASRRRSSTSRPASRSSTARPSSTRDYNTLIDALQAVPGVRVSQSGGPGGNASVFVRGTNSNQVLVLRDGMPINDASRLLRRVQFRH